MLKSTSYLLKIIDKADRMLDSVIKLEQGVEFNKKFEFLHQEFLKYKERWEPEQGNLVVTRDYFTNTNDTSFSVRAGVLEPGTLMMILSIDFIEGKRVCPWNYDKLSVPALHFTMLYRDKKFLHKVEMIEPIYVGFDPVKKT